MAATAAPKKKSNSTPIALVVLAVILIGGCLGVLKLLGAGPFAGPAGPNLADAYYNSQVYVKDKLKAPDTAKFPNPNTDAGIVTKDLGGNRAEVTAYVDSANALGVMLRSHYVAVLAWKSASVWTLISLKFLD